MTREVRQCCHGINGNTFQFYVPPMTQDNPRKRDPGKIRARWSNKSRYNPIKPKRPNTPETMMTKLDTIDIDKKVPLQGKICDKYGPSCSFCKHGTPHPLPQESDWSDKDWDGTRAKAQKETGETNLLSDWDLLKSQSEPNSKLEVDKLDIDQLHLEQDSPKEEWIEVTNSQYQHLQQVKKKRMLQQKKQWKRWWKWKRDTNKKRERFTLQEKVYISQLVMRKKETLDQNMVTAILVKRERTFLKNEL